MPGWGSDCGAPAGEGGPLGARVRWDARAVEKERARTPPREQATRGVQGCQRARARLPGDRGSDNLPALNGNRSEFEGDFALDAQSLLELLQRGGLTVYPLALASVVSLGVLLERLWRFRGIDRDSRSLTRATVERLVRRDLGGARVLCEKAGTPLAGIFLEAMRWRSVVLEDLERVLATSRQEAAQRLKRGLWLVGTVGSLAPYVGLFGTVVGIIRAFRDMAIHGAGGFEVVAAGISEALVATAAGLVVAITALSFFNYLQVRAQGISATYARCCERFVQALVYVEASAAEPAGGEAEVGGGRLVPAR